VAALGSGARWPHSPAACQPGSSVSSVVRCAVWMGAVSATAPAIRIRGIEAGLHAVLELPNGVDEKELVARAEENSPGLHGLNQYRQESLKGQDAVVVGYGTPAEHAYPAALRALATMLRETTTTTPLATPSPRLDTPPGRRARQA